MKLYTYEELLEMGITPDYKPKRNEDWFFIKNGDKIAALYAVNYEKK
jgi:transketolase N-terminal domain/subunit